MIVVQSASCKAVPGIRTSCIFGGYAILDAGTNSSQHIDLFGWTHCCLPTPKLQA